MKCSLLFFVSVLALRILASIIVMWFSHQREFRPDRGAAQQHRDIRTGRVAA